MEIKKLSRSQIKKKVKTWLFYKKCQEDFFWRQLNKLHYKVTVAGVTKFNNWLKTLKTFYKKKTIKGKRQRYNKRYLYYVWRLSDVHLRKRYRRKKFKTNIGIYIKKFRYYYNNMNVSRIKVLGAELNKTFWSCFQTFFFKIETRLDVLAYRFHFCKSTREAKHFVQTENLCVNGKIVNYHYANINIGDIISIKFNKRKQLQMHLLSSLKQIYLTEFKKPSLFWIKKRRYKRKRYFRKKKRFFYYEIFRIKKVKKRLKKKKYFIFFFPYERLWYKKKRFKERLRSLALLKKCRFTFTYYTSLKKKVYNVTKEIDELNFFHQTFILYNYPVYFEVNWRILKGILVRQRIFLTPKNVPNFTEIYAELTFNLCLR